MISLVITNLIAGGRGGGFKAIERRRRRRGIFAQKPLNFSA